MKRFESFFEGLSKLQLFYQTWEAENVRANLVITHGHGEHSEAYARFVEDLGELPIKIWAWDWRGHGRSQGARGAVPDFYVYTQEYELFLRRIVEIEKSKVPTILMGHSMGALIQLKTMLGCELVSATQILSSPFFDVSMPVPAWKRTLSRAILGIYPQLTLNSQIRFEDLISIPELQEDYRRDPYRHQMICPGAFEGALQSGQSVLKQAANFTGPCLCIGPERDPVVATDRFREFFKATGSRDKRLRLYKGRMHEVLNDRGREEPIALIREFILERLK